MGTTGSSSKRKFSSSLSKKRSKNSSQVQKRKRIQSKSKRNKSKKLRRRDDSVSYSDDDSRSSVSIPSSSSEDEYRRRRSRSRTRRDVRVSKKKVRRNSSSPESIQDSPRIKKRKRSKRNANLDTKKKTHKKKRKRDASISSMRSSSSCSTCRDGSSSSGESKYKKPRGKRERKEREKRDIGKSKSGTKRSRYRSRSYSSCSRCSKGSGYQSEEKLIDGNSSRRLRSVITIVREPEENEERELDEDGHKEEFVYDHDDYPSSRSNDSNDGESKRELAHHSLVTSEKKRQTENVKGEEAYISNIQTTKVTESGNDGGGRYDGSIPSFDGVEANNCLKENKSEVSVAIGSPTSDDLESILRQRALENLRKFRGGVQTNAGTTPDQQGKSGNDGKQSSTAKAESVQIKSHKEDSGRVVSATQVVDQICMPPTGRNSIRSLQSDGKIPDGEYSKNESGGDKSVQIMSQKQDVARVVRATQAGVQISVPTIGRNSNFSRNDGKISVGKYSETESGSAKRDVTCPPNRLATGVNPKEKDSSASSAIIDKSKPGTSALRREPSGSYSTLKQVPISQASPKGRLLSTKSSVDTSVAETSQTVPRSGNDNSKKVSDACGSAAPELTACPTSSSGEQSSKDPQSEAKDGSQFEQKTMSVMRGGELVQVSYKVYIPKKTPALARRQLQR